MRDHAALEDVGDRRRAREGDEDAVGLVRRLAALDGLRDPHQRGDARAHRRRVELVRLAAPRSRKTHKYFPAPARARVAELMRIAQAIKRGKASYEADGNYVSFAHPVSVADVFESCVVPHLIASALWR